MFARSLIAISIALASVGAQAATTVFEDNFDANALGLNVVPTGWAVTAGTVDVIGQPGYYDMLLGNGRYIDLDGSTGAAGVLSKTLNLVAGVEYTATFQLAGNQRNAGPDVVDVIFGGVSGSYSLAPTSGFTSYSLVFTPSTSQAYVLSFDDLGGDNQGALLDNVNVTAVPEPGSLALVLAGLGVVGFAARRRF